MNLLGIVYKKFNSLDDIQQAFQNNKSCIKFLEYLIWEGVPVSPYDINSEVYKLGNGRYRCKNTGKDFNVLKGTIFENTKIPLRKWFQVIYLMISHRSGISARSIARDFKISRVSALKMTHKLQHAMKFENGQILDGIVETDEYYVGGSLKTMHYDKKIEAKKKPYQNKKLLQGFIQRGGNAVIRVIPDMLESTINAGILKHVRPGSKLYSDDNSSYQKLPSIYERGTSIHSKGNYVNKDNKNIHTNGQESVWARFEKMEDVHVHMSQKYLQFYANECVFRYNTRKMNIGDASIHLLLNIQNTKITWKELKSA